MWESPLFQTMDLFTLIGNSHNMEPNNRVRLQMERIYFTIPMSYFTRLKLSWALSNLVINDAGTSVAWVYNSSDIYSEARSQLTVISRYLFYCWPIIAHCLRFSLSCMRICMYIAITKWCRSDSGRIMLRTLRRAFGIPGVYKEYGSLVFHVVTPGPELAESNRYLGSMGQQAYCFGGNYNNYIWYDKCCVKLWSTYIANTNEKWHRLCVRNYCVSPL